MCYKPHQGKTIEFYLLEFPGPQQGYLNLSVSSPLFIFCYTFLVIHNKTDN